MKKKYGNKCQLLYTDTDSLIYEIETKDLYKDLVGMKEWFDFSDYPTAHPLHSINNKKIPGKFKDETYGVPIKEFAVVDQRCGL